MSLEVELERLKELYTEAVWHGGSLPREAFEKAMLNALPKLLKTIEIQKEALKRECCCTEGYYEGIAACETCERLEEVKALWKE